MQNLRNITEALDTARKDLFKMSRITEHYDVMNDDELMSFQAWLESTIKILNKANDEVTESITSEMILMHNEVMKKQQELDNANA